jgi:hypothetical protein
MSLGLTVIADGKSLVQNYFTFTSINKVSQFFFFLSIAAERKHIIQNSSRINLLTFLLIGTKKDKGRANRQCGCRSREAAH